MSYLYQPKEYSKANKIYQNKEEHKSELVSHIIYSKLYKHPNVKIINSLQISRFRRLNVAEEQLDTENITYV